MRADKYYGDAVLSYEAERCCSVRWAREQIAVDDFVATGPILDVPLGTARYREIYRAKRLKVCGLDISDDMLAIARRNAPEIEARRGSVLSLPYADGSFGTVVCTRMLDWLSPVEMPKAVAELRRVARELVVTVRHGKLECRVNQTHGLAEFLATVNGLHTDARRVTERSKDGTEEIFHLRPPRWSDVIEQFQWHGPSAEYEITRLTNEWLAASGRNPLAMADEISESNWRIIAEYWNAEQCGYCIRSMAGNVDSYKTSDPPRFDPWRPATVLNYRGVDIVIDGRRRMNLWMQSEGRFPVLWLWRK